MDIRDIPLTYEDYKALSASTDDRYELIDGEIYMVPAPTVAHQVVSRNLSVLLQLHARAKSCGLVLYAPVDVVVGAGARRSVVQPDVLFVSNDRMGIVTKAEIVGAPDLVVEILSPGTAERDRSQKKALYSRNRVREYWIVDVELESIEVFALSARGYERPVRYEEGDTLISAVVPGLEVSVAEVFMGQPTK
jgi:Uma2 family endonuclease